MSLLIGKTLASRYRLEEFIGRGGMAEVYKVWDAQRSTFLAMKVLNEDLAIDRVFLRRFQREAQTLAKLQHPRIVRFYGLEQVGPQAFMLLDYIEGKSLKRLIFDQDGPVPFEYIETIFRSICTALQYAHTEGLVHCDMKPGNVMINRTGDVLVMDFGISRMADAATATMVGMGTPAYMAPEQARGLDPVPQTDIYALGIMLFEMLTGGERPFTGESAETTGSTSERVRWEQINLDAPSPRQWNPKVTPELETIIFKCLAKRPKDRYQTPLEFLNDLQHALVRMGVAATERVFVSVSDFDESESVTELVSPPPLYDKPISKPVTKQPWFWPLIGVGVVALGALLFSGNGKTDPLAVTQTALAIQQTQTALAFVPPQAGTSVPAETPKLNTLTPSVFPTQTFTQEPVEQPIHTFTSEPIEPSTQTPLPTRGIGSTQISSQDSMVQVYVPDGDFLMGAVESDPFAVDDEFPAHSVYLDAYWIDQTEVTNAMYANFVEAIGYRTQAEKIGWSWDFDGSWQQTSGADWRHPYGPSTSIQGLSEHPVLRVSWDDAYAYCSWAGRRLPTEAEWEKAARGTDGQMFPWGNSEPSAGLLNFDKNLGSAMSVGSYPSGVSQYGALDMSGNVWEWVSDWYQKGYYSSSPGSNPQGPPTGDGRGMRGGSWLSDRAWVRSSFREWGRQNESYWSTGFRCASEAP